MYTEHAEAAISQEMSFDEFMRFIDLPENQDKTFELISGYVVAMAGNTTSKHQSISGDIARIIGNYLKGKECKVFQDLNVFLYRVDINKCDKIFQPDVFIGCNRSKMTDRGYEDTPEFVAEVISKSTARNDYFTKCSYYMEYGVKEYWIVDLFANQILVYLNQEEESPIVHKYTFDDQVKVSLFDGLYIDFKEVLASLPS